MTTQHRILPLSTVPPVGWLLDVPIGSRAEVLAGPYAELCGVVTWMADEHVWLRLDGDAVDLRFRRVDVGPAGQ